MQSDKVNRDECHSTFAPSSWHLQYAEQSIDWELPWYLFPEARSASAPLSDIAVGNHVLQCDFRSSRWDLHVLQKPAADDTSPPSSDAIVPEHLFARLVVQGTFIPIHLDDSALDARLGFSAEAVTRGLDRVAGWLSQKLRDRVRPLIGCSVSKEDAVQEETELRKVLFTNHFVNVLAWQRLQEILATAADATPTEALRSPRTMVNPVGGVDECAGEPLAGLSPSLNPWQDDYDDSFIAFPEKALDERLSIYKLLSQHIAAGKRFWASKSSVSVQTGDDLRERCRGVVPTTSPYADIRREGLPFDAAPLSGFWDEYVRVGPTTTMPRAPAWRVEIRSIEHQNPHHNPNRQEPSSSYYILAEFGHFMTVGRTAGFHERMRTFVHCGLEDKTSCPKRVSLHHATLAVGQDGTTLTVVACGRNGVRIVGQKYLLAGCGATIKSQNATDEKPVLVAITPDVHLSITYVAAATSSPVAEPELLANNSAMDGATP